MCSRYLTSADASNRRALSVGGGGARYSSYNTEFTADALPGAERAAEALSPAEAVAFLDHLFGGLLSKARSQGVCGSCFAYSITGAMQYAAQLAYRRLGAFFDSKYMAHQYILSCMEVEGAACGCWGGDLALALAAVAERGLVTYQQFPYENQADVVTHEGQNHFFCKANLDAGGFLGTCGPCAPGEPALELVLPEGSAEASTSLFDTAVTCIPCDVAAGPFYHPLRPFRLCDAASPLQANVDAVKRALRDLGPVCTALRVNQRDFARLKRSVVLSHLHEAEVYRPEQAPSVGGLHAVLVVGYHDPWAGSGRQEDRTRAVFVCRNSWGDDWGFRIRTRSVSVDKGGRLRVTPLETGGFFAVSMYEATEQSGLLSNAVAMAGVDLRPTRDLPRRPLSLEDPFLRPYPAGFLEELLRFELDAASGSLSASYSSFFSSPAASLPAGLSAPLLLLLLLLLLLAVWL
jgi:hypothetical protein